MKETLAKTQPKVVETITNDEDDIRFRLYEFKRYEKEYYYWEAAKDLVQRERTRCEKKVLRQERRIMRMGLTINALMEHIDMLTNNPLVIREEDNNVVELVTLDGKRLAKDNKFPPSGGNWLAELKPETIFVCEPNVDIGMQTTIQQEYCIESKQEEDGVVKSVLLLVNLNEPEVSARVNPERFCKYYNLVSILYEPSAEEVL